MEWLQKAAFVVVCGVSAFVANPAHGQLIVNPGFDSEGLSPWSAFRTGGVQNMPIGVGMFNTTGTSYNRAAYFQAGAPTQLAGVEGGGIFQTFYGGEGDYTLSVNVASMNQWLYLDASGSNFTLFFNSAVVATYNSGPVFAGGGVNRGSLTGTVRGVSEGVQEVRLLVTRVGSAGSPFASQYADNFTVTYAPAAVPEPSPSALAALAGAGAVASHLARRRRAAAA